ncbi:DegV family protein [Paenibacillus sp. KN14-4R]|uniref:DegV family protein n=1 Tax=Paenibacillus sp. KN14-4R TaxID=3445773 RepID=UPI003FA0ECA3
MSKIRIVTDSTADIPEEIRKELGIECIPLKILFGEDTYLDGVTMTQDTFYDRLVTSSIIPTTSQPSPQEFLDVYQQIASEDPESSIISIHLASVLSGTYQSAVIAKSMMEDQVPITVIDSMSASYGIGGLVVAAAKAAKEGKSVAEIVKLIEDIQSNHAIFFMVNTLEYLQKGGRIGRASALIGSLLNIKPILTIDDEGYVSSKDKARGQKKALTRIVELLEERFPKNTSLDIKMAHIRNPETAEQLQHMIEEKFDVRSVEYITIGPVIGTHVGPGLVAVFAFLA